MHLQFWNRKPLLHSLNQGVIIVYHFHILDFGGSSGIHFQSKTVDCTSRLFDMTSHFFFICCIQFQCIARQNCSLAILSQNTMQTFLLLGKFFP